MKKLRSKGGRVVKLDEFVRRVRFIMGLTNTATETLIRLVIQEITLRVAMGKPLSIDGLGHFFFPQNENRDLSDNNGLLPTRKRIVFIPCSKVKLPERPKPESTLTKKEILSRIDSTRHWLKRGLTKPDKKKKEKES